MAEIVYEIVEHDGGYAYKVGDVFSETFATHAGAVDAAKAAASRQEKPGETEAIQFQDDSGRWREELARGGDRPETGVEDAASEGEASGQDSPAAQIIGTTKVPLRRHEKEEVDPRSSPFSDTSEPKGNGI